MRGPLRHLKILWTLVRKWLKIGPAFSTTSINSAFCFVVRRCTRRSANVNLSNFAKQKEARMSEPIRWHHIVNVNETIDSTSLVYYRDPKNISVSNGITLGGLHWQIHCWLPHFLLPPFLIAINNHILKKPHWNHLACPRY